MRTGALALVAVILLAGCGVTLDPYPLPAGPPGASVFHAVELDEPASEAVLFIEARPGHHVEIVSAEPVGQFEGASVSLFASSLTVDASGDVVVGDERQELEGAVIGDLAGTSEDAPADQVAIVAEITAEEAGRYVLSGIHLTYRLDGAPERSGEGIDVVMTVCADDPAPTDCDDDPGS